jgi:hypothetical protein
MYIVVDKPDGSSFIEESFSSFREALAGLGNSMPEDLDYEICLVTSPSPQSFGANRPCFGGSVSTWVVRSKPVNKDELTRVLFFHEMTGDELADYLEPPTQCNEYEYEDDYEYTPSDDDLAQWASDDELYASEHTATYGLRPYDWEIGK